MRKAKKITQESLIKRYLTKNKVFIPAFKANSSYCGYWFGSEVARICRFMRKDKVLVSKWVKTANGKRYIAFFLSKKPNSQAHA